MGWYDVASEFQLPDEIAQAVRAAMESRSSSRREHYRKVRWLPKRSMIVDVFRDYVEGLSADAYFWKCLHLMEGSSLITEPAHDLLRGWPRKVVIAAEREAFGVPRNPERYRYARYRADRRSTEANTA